MKGPCAILSSVACPALLYFPHYLINGTIFEKKKKYMNTKCLDVFLTVHHELIIYLLPTFVHWLLFIHKILISSTCFEPQVLTFRRIQLYKCSVWYCHSLWEFLVACRYTAWVRTDCRGKVVGGCLKTPTNNLPPPVSSHSSCVPTGHQELS